MISLNQVIIEVYHFYRPLNPLQSQHQNVSRTTYCTRMQYKNKRRR
ncbi:unnamed protein product [Amoebophrya sp. A25]|nr:unnamed protein product [Amoebophrya sp. A25]|eukprot:GSA25T00011620001.1